MAHVRLDHGLLAEQSSPKPRGLGAGQLIEHGQAGAGHTQGYGSVTRGEHQSPRDLIERSGLNERGRAREHTTLLRHEDIVDGEVVRPRAAQAPHVPGIEQLGLGHRHE